MFDRQRYAPPPISQTHLCSQMLALYPSHKEQPELIRILVHEYLKVWQLTLAYGEKRIVATGCILAVQTAHQMMSREYYFHDCIAYFSRYVGRREWAWHGYSDVRGTLDTLGSYTEFFSDPPCEPWKDMTNAHALKKQKFTIVH